MNQSRNTCGWTSIIEPRSVRLFDVLCFESCRLDTCSREDGGPTQLNPRISKVTLLLIATLFSLQAHMLFVSVFARVASDCCCFVVLLTCIVNQTQRPSKITSAAAESQASNIMLTSVFIFIIGVWMCGWMRVWIGERGNNVSFYHFIFWPKQFVSFSGWDELDRFRFVRVRQRTWPGNALTNFLTTKENSTNRKTHNMHRDTVSGGWWEG